MDGFLYVWKNQSINMEKKNTTLLVGAGAVENAWKPVIDAIKTVTSKDISTGDAANCFFAQMVYLARFYSSINHPDCPTSLKVIIDNINIIKKAIAENLKKAQQKGEIKVRPEFKNIVSEFIIKKQNSVAVISTNWDTVIDNEMSRIYRQIGCNLTPVLHIHGDIFSDIYLPTEITAEKYRQTKEESYFGNKHINFRDLLENTDELIIYGLSLSPLDAELLQSLCHLGKTEKVFIIDPNHEKVKENLLAIMVNPNIPVIGYHPSEIQTEVETSSSLP